MSGRQKLIELDHRETNVLTRLAWGWSIEAISKDIGITVNEARTVRQAVLRRLGADNTPHAVALGIGYELLPADVATNPTLPGGSREPVPPQR